MNLKLSEWQDGVPTLIGVYETTKQHNNQYFQYWNGEFWGYTSYTIEGATVCKLDCSDYQKGKWRGVIEE